MRARVGSSDGGVRAASRRSATPACDTTARGTLAAPPGRVAREGRAGSRPESEVPAGAVPDRSDAFEVQRSVELAQKVDAGGDIGKRLGPAAAVPDAPVLEIPGGDACRARSSQSFVINEQSYAAFQKPPWMTMTTPCGAGLIWKKQLAVLARVVSVAVQRALDWASVACSERTAS